MDLKDYIRSIEDYPKKGILFRDITTLIKDELAFEETINQIVERSKKLKVDKIAAIESENGCDIDYEWQIPAVEFWLKKNGYKKLRS